MGHTYVDITIYGRDSTRSKSIRLLVDTGSTYTWVGSKLLRELAIQPLKEREFRTVEGRKPRRRVGEALIEAFGEKATTIVVFAEKNDARVLGRSEEHTSELQSLRHLVCRLLLEKKN